MSVRDSSPKSALNLRIASVLPALTSASNLSTMSLTEATQSEGPNFWIGLNLLTWQMS